MLCGSFHAALTCRREGERERGREGEEEREEIGGEERRETLETVESELRDK